MGGKSIHFLGLACRKSLFFLFAIATLLFFLSWFFLLGSTGASRLIDNHRLPTGTRIFSVAENATAAPLCRPNGVSSVDNSSGLQEQQINTCDPKHAMLKVFMYDLPPEYHFGMLDWKPEANSKSVWPDITKKIPGYPGGLNLQHSIEYWLTLDLLSSTLPDRPGPCTAVRVLDAKEADVMLVPFFSSLSYNRYTKKVNKNNELQGKIVKYLMEQKEWKRSGGRDHVIMAHHPNSMLEARMKLWPCMFILSDFGRYPPNIANVEKDVIAPYRHMIRTYVNDSAGFDDRPTLLYFQGAIYRKDGGFIRQELFYLLKNEKDVHFSFGSIRQNGISEATRGMHGSKFCLNIAGDTPSSNRLFDAIASHCVPVIISDEIELPYEDVLDYSKFCVFVRSGDAMKKDFLINLIRGISCEQWTRMWEKLKEVEHYFEFHYPAQKDDAVQMIWQAVARKLPLLRLKLHRWKRFAQFEAGLKPSRFSPYSVS